MADILMVINDLFILLLWPIWLSLLIMENWGRDNKCEQYNFAHVGFYGYY